MAQKRAYNRYFIILQEDKGGHALVTDKVPSGYAKLETKNDKSKVSYYVQNLNREKMPYYMVLICSKKEANKLIKLGELNVDESGRSEITYDIQSESICGSKLPVDTISGAAILRFEEGKAVSVMSGFASKDIPNEWQSYNMYEPKSDGVEEAVRNKSDEVVEEVAEPIKQQQTQNAEEINTHEEERSSEINEGEAEEEPNVFEEYEQQIEDAKEKNADDTDMRHKKSKEEHEKEHYPHEEHHHHEEHYHYHHEEHYPHEEHHNHEVEHKHYEHKMFEENDDYPIGAAGQFFKLLVDDFRREKSICTEIKRCNWYFIPIDNFERMQGSIDYNKYMVVYYPMINYYNYIKKHDGYMIGLKYDSNGEMKYLVYAIEGNRYREDQPFEGKTGFVTWVPINEGDDDGYGFWLMFYDFRTSTIVIPIK